MSHVLYLLPVPPPLTLSSHMISFQALRDELRPTIRLALPLVLAEIGWMSMGIVDTIMVGHLPDSARAIGSVSISSNLFNVLAFFGGGLLIGLDTLVAQAFGAGKREDCHRSLINSIYLSIVMTPFLMTPVWFFNPLLRRLHIDPQVSALAVPYMKALAFGLFPLLLYFAVRRCLQAMNMAQPIAFALVSANIINAFFNWILIYGKWGAPRMGVVGSGWSTAISRVYLAAVLVSYLLWYDRRHRTELLKTPVNIDFLRIRRLISLGLPAAVQITLEISVFALATALIGRLGAVALASHQIALNTVAFTYMVPLGISSAAAVRVGHAIGRGKPASAGDAGYTAIFLGAGFMTLAAIALLVFPRWIARMYTPDESNPGKPVAVEVRATAKPVLLVLTSYMPAVWNVRRARGARIQAVVVGSGMPQEIEARLSVRSAHSDLRRRSRRLQPGRRGRVHQASRAAHED